MQGTPNDRVLDLNALLAERRLDPVEVKLGDDTYMVNTDLTAAEAQAFLNLMRNGHDASAFTLLIGTPQDRKKVLATVEKQENVPATETVLIHASTKARRLNAYVDTLPRMHQALVSGSLMRASKALVEFAKTDDDILQLYGYGLEPEGESTAS